MMRERDRSRLDDRAGFSLVELLVYLVISVLILFSIYQVLAGQSRLYTKQREVQDVRHTLRSAAAMMAYQLRQVSTMEGDLISISPTSIQVRSFRAFGYICAEHPDLQIFGLAHTSGDWWTVDIDSATVLAVDEPGADDDNWRVVDMLASGDPASIDMNTCFWGDTLGLVGRGRPIKSETGSPWSGGSTEPEIAIRLDGNVDSVYMGAPVWGFVDMEYTVKQFEDGRYWLVGTPNGGNDIKFTGPMRSPADSGLHFTYYDANGDPTTDPAAVSLIEMILWGESLKGVRQVEGAPKPQTDSVRVRISLRN